MPPKTHRYTQGGADLGLHFGTVLGEQGQHQPRRLDADPQQDHGQQQDCPQFGGGGFEQVNHLQTGSRASPCSPAATVLATPHLPRICRSPSRRLQISTTSKFSWV